MWSPGLWENHHRNDHLSANALSLCVALLLHDEYRRSKGRRHARRERVPSPIPPHHPLSRRNPSLRQVAARSAAATRREGLRRPRGRHHRKPLSRREPCTFPCLSVQQALLSRCQVIPLPSLSVSQIASILQNALQKDPDLDKEVIVGAGVHRRNASPTPSSSPSRIRPTEMRASRSPCSMTCSTARRDRTSTIGLRPSIDESIIRKLTPQHFIRYDKHGEEHFNVISALHKAIVRHPPSTHL